MKKIPTVFVRDEITHQVTPITTPGCEWIHDAAKVDRATVKWDGTAIKTVVDALGGCLYLRRYDAKPDRNPPPGFEPAQERDVTPGHWPGWIPIDLTSKEGKRVVNAFVVNRFALAKGDIGQEIENGTYELCGPTVNGNPQGFVEHVLIRHGAEIYPIEAPFTFERIRQALTDHPYIEGIVFYAVDGKMAKIKRRDFPGLPWPATKWPAKQENK